MANINAGPFTTRPQIDGTFGVVASTHWIATAVGMGMLERGGNAFDAGVATAFALSLSSGDSVATILTGVSPSTLGVVNHPNRLGESWSTLAEAFHDGGYRTAFSNPHPLLTPDWGFAQGFEEYRYLHRPVRWDVSLLARLMQRFNLNRPTKGYQANTVTDFAIDLLR